MKNLNITKPVLFVILILMAAQVRSQQALPVDSQRIQQISAARTLIQSVAVCALITLDGRGLPNVRSMSPFQPDSNMVIWFGTNIHSRKVKEIKQNPRVTIYYPAPDQSGYVVIRGMAELIDDKAKKEQYWKPEWQSFYPDYPEGYLLIKVLPEWLEVISFRSGITGDSTTWAAPRIWFSNHD